MFEPIHEILTDLPGNGETLLVKAFAREAIAAGKVGVWNRETVLVLQNLAVCVNTKLSDVLH